MLTKRAAIVAALTVATIRTAQADQAGSMVQWSNGMPDVAATPPGPFFQAPDMSTTWTIDLDTMGSLAVEYKGKTVTITAAELFAALST